MTEKNSPPKTVPKEEDLSNQLSRLLDRYFSHNPENWTEAFIEEGGSGGLIRRKDDGGHVIQISAMPAETGGGFSFFGEENLGPKGITGSEIIDAIDGLESPATTDEELSEILDCPKEEVLYHLDQLKSENKVESKESGDITIWWRNESHKPDNTGELENELPNRLREILKKEKTEGESLSEVYERIKGNPPKHMIKEIVEDISLDTDAMRDVIKSKRETGISNREDLKERFE